MDENYPQVVSILSKNFIGEFQYYSHIASELIHRIIYFRHQKRIFNNGFLGYKQIEDHPWFKETDIIHLHWINQGTISVEQIGRLSKPIVSTMRDMWPMTGGCLYAMECEAYRSACGFCPVLRSSRKPDLSSWNQKRKERVFSGKKMHLVATSPWLADCARQSTALRGQPVEMIPKGVDTETFYPIPKEEARRRLGWNQDERLFWSERSV